MNFFNRRTMTGTGLAILAVLLVALIALSNVLLRGLRVDLTENNQYTISSGTKGVLKKIDEPINLYFYYSEKTTREIFVLRNYAQRVREMLDEIVSKSNGKLKLQVIDPQAFSEDEDRATNFGLQALPIGPSGEKVFLGLAGSNSTDGQAIIPFFQPDKEVFLEYDLAKLIQSLTIEEKPVVGVISGLAVGPSFDPASRSSTQGWVLFQQMQEFFDVRQLNGEALESLDPAIKTLVVVHPKGLSDAVLYTIDQFVMRGGKLMVFVDPYAEMDRGSENPEASPQDFANRASDLPKLFSAWGIEYDATKVLLDGEHALAIQVDPARPPVRHLAILGFTNKDLNATDIISAQLDTINFASAGRIGLTPESTLKLSPLVQSSAQSMLGESNRLLALQDPEVLFDGFVPTEQNYVIAARLSGKLKSAFPENLGDTHLAQTKTDAQILLVADTDILTDRLWVSASTNPFGQQTLNAFANNGDFVINAVDVMSGSDDLISIRGRASSARPFTRVDALRVNADERFRAKEAQLQEQLAETERKLNDMQQNKSDQQALVLSKEQQSEVQKFQDQKLQIRKDLRQVRRQLDADIEKLSARLKFLNIFLMPMLVTIAAAGFHFWKRKKRRDMQRGSL